MKRWAFFIYSVGVYGLFLGTFLYAIGFVGNYHFGPWHGLWLVPKSMDLGNDGGPVWKAIVVDALLLGVFAVQHSGMARRGFKERWTRVIPRSIERSTYVLFTCGALALLFALWRPIGAAVWAFEDGAVVTALVVASLVGWCTVLIGTLHIDHLELFGLRQGLHALLGRDMPRHRFVTPGLYKAVRHPIYLGFLIAFWATPVMTAGHLVFAIATTGYILVAIQLEERDLVRDYGSDYERYRRQVAMLAPLPRRSELTQSAKMGS